MTHNIEQIQRPMPADGCAKAVGAHALAADALSAAAQASRVPGDTARLAAAFTFARVAHRGLAGRGGGVPALRLLLRATAVMIGRATTAAAAASALRTLADEIDPPHTSEVA